MAKWLTSRLTRGRKQMQMRHHRNAALVRLMHGASGFVRLTDRCRTSHLSVERLKGDSLMRRSKTVPYLLGLSLAMLLFASPGQASALSRVADLTTAIPNGTGTFTNVVGPVLSGGNVAFLGVGSSGQEGIYLFNGSALSRVADKNTAIPNGTGNFTSFGGPLLSGANVAFFADGSSGQEGFYLFNGSALSRVADLNTTIPNGTGNFTGFGLLALSGGNVTFHGVGSSGQGGIYLFNGSALSRVADKNTAIPNGTGNFTGFGDPVLSGGNVAFFAVGSSQEGIYLFTGKRAEPRGGQEHRNPQRHRQLHGLRRPRAERGQRGVRWPREFRANGDLPRDVLGRRVPEHVRLHVQRHAVRGLLPRTPARRPDRRRAGCEWHRP